MADYVKLGGAVVHPWAGSSYDGTVTYVQREHGPAGDAVHGRGRAEAKIVAGVAARVDLVPGWWDAVVLPDPDQDPKRRDARKFQLMLFVREDVDAMTIREALVIPDARGRDVQQGKPGAPGLSAFELAQQQGYQGSLADWLLETKGQSTGVEVEDMGNGTSRLWGGGVTDLGNGTSLVVNRPTPTGELPWSANPLAARLGRPITGLYYDETTDSIFSGYGDWTANKDEIGVVRHDRVTGRAEIVYFPDLGANLYRPDYDRPGAYTEAIESFYRAKGDGVLYIPHIDGSGYWEGCGYISDEGGRWGEHHLPGQAIHVFGVVENSQGVWMCGSGLWPQSPGVAVTGGPVLWFRPFGGPRWHEVFKEPVKVGTLGFERYYGMRVAGDRVEVMPSDGRTNWADSYLDPAIRSFRYVPPEGGGSYDELVLPDAARTIVSRPITLAEDRDWPTYFTNRITVGSWTYRGTTNGQILREAAPR